MVVDFSEFVFGFLLKEVKNRNFLYRMLTGSQRDIDKAKSKENIINFYEEGCLKEIIASLRYSQDLSNLDLNLSILGICSMKMVCAEQMIIKYNLLQHLSYILSRYDQDQIQRRVFRIIRNLCCCQQKNYLIFTSESQKRNFTETVINKESELYIIAKIMRYLETVVDTDNESFLLNNVEPCSSKNTSEATITIAIQIVREVANSVNVVPLVKDYRIMKVLGLLLIKFTFLWQNAKKCEKIVLNTLHAIFKLLHYYHFKNCAKCDMVLELEDTEKGNSLECLGKLVPLSPLIVVKVAVYIIDLKKEARNLPVNSILNECIKKLDNPKDFQRGREDAEHEDYLRYVFILLSVVQNKNLAISVLPTFNRVLKDYSKPTEIALKNCACIISLLRQTLNLQSMLEYGIIDTILEKLDLVLGADIDMDTYHAIKRNDWGYSRLHKKVKLSQNNYSVSESSEDSRLSSTSYSTSSDSSSYSDEEDDVLYDCGSIQFACLKQQLSNQIISFIKPLVSMPSVTMKIISSNVLTKLLMFLLPVYYPLCCGDIIKVILSVAQNPGYRLEIMQTNFIIVASEFVQRLHLTMCKTCKTLGKVHEYVLWAFIKFVEFPEGPLRHLLDQANHPMKQKLASVIPYLINNKKTLSYLMLSCRGLNIIIEYLKENEDGQDLNTQQRCVGALYTLAKQLGIQSYECEDVNINFSFPSHAQQNEVRKKSAVVVRFKMDDGKCFEEDRSFLCEKSDYFNRLLSGEFKESVQEEVHLCNVSSKSFETLMMFLHCDIVSEAYPVLEIGNIKLDILLDVLSLANRYILEDLCSYITKCIQCFKFSCDNVPVIYKWSLESKTNILRVETIAYVLAGKMNKSERFDMFKKLLQLEYSEYFVKDIQKLLTGYLF